MGHEAFLIDEGGPDASPDSTVVLLHGFPESSYSYAGTFPLLAECFDRVLSFDFIGFGFSAKPSTGFAYSLVEQADVALRLIRQAGVTGCHFVAHDMGDSVMTEILARLNDNQPDWFDPGAISVSFTNGSMVLGDAKLRVGQRALVSPAGKLLSRVMDNPRIFEKQVVSAQGNDRLTGEQILDMYSAAATDAPRGLMAELIGYLRERRRFEKSRWLPAVRDAAMPVQICWGADDAVAPVAIARRLKEEIKPEAKLTVMDGLGHFAQIQDPAAWFGGLSPFWSEIA
ncbi:MAG: alpha/beta hydrolase [Solirubrobacterales bacterium]|nr:alpha/beta hydrolase [Solirubrobacterales bacterium]MCB8915146.1 alpha/beta hydrolase [Thermoleophilales bacterium]